MNGKLNLRNLNQYKLLYNNLWQIDPIKANKLNIQASLGRDWANEKIKSYQVENTNKGNIEVDLVKPIVDKYNKVASAEHVELKLVDESCLAHLQGIISDKAQPAQLTHKEQNQNSQIAPTKIINKETSESLVQDWDTLVSEINNCAKCELCHGRQNVVIERGSRAAKWMLIGEGPGEQEDIQGKPFVGSSGELLQKMLSAMNLNSDTDVYICNVVKCRPPSNRNPEPVEIETCKNYLFSQIALVKPQIIITLGRFAAQTLLNTTKATGKLRGEVHNYQNIPLIVTYHPSYLLRNPAAKKDSWVDLQLAMQIFESNREL
jgi:uracil-DNA glycosylase